MAKAFEILFKDLTGKECRVIVPRIGNSDLWSSIRSSSQEICHMITAENLISARIIRKPQWCIILHDGEKMVRSIAEYDSRDEAVWRAREKYYKLSDNDKKNSIFEVAELEIGDKGPIVDNYKPVEWRMKSDPLNTNQG